MFRCSGECVCVCMNESYEEYIIIMYFVSVLCVMPLKLLPV